MLERPGLWLGPWQPPAADKAGTVSRERTVLDAGGERLGVVRRQADPTWPLLRWLARQIVRVYETEDESLLCTLQRSWSLSRSWEVRDAEGRHVATVHSGWVLDGGGYLLARIERPGPEGGRFVDPEGGELANFRLNADGVGLTFAGAREGDPFARMALLGAALSLDA